jgi:hypothetical protein
MPAVPLAPVPVTHVVEVEAPTSPPASTTVNVDALISAGLGHQDTTIHDLALALTVGAERLATALVAWEQRNDALAEVTRLEQLLTVARTAAGLDVPPSHRIPRPKPQPVAGRATPAEIRGWAAGNGVVCPARGIVPRHVVDAYLDAHAEAAS